MAIPPDEACSHVLLAWHIMDDEHERRNEANDATTAIVDGRATCRVGSSFFVQERTLARGGMGVGRLSLLSDIASLYPLSISIIRSQNQNHPNSVQTNACACTPSRLAGSGNKARARSPDLLSPSSISIVFSKGGDRGPEPELRFSRTSVNAGRTDTLSLYRFTSDLVALNDSASPANKMKAFVVAIALVAMPLAVFSWPGGAPRCLFVPAGHVNGNGQVPDFTE